jgi:hypothetical protein
MLCVHITLASRAQIYVTIRMGVPGLKREYFECNQDVSPAIRVKPRLSFR